MNEAHFHSILFHFKKFKPNGLRVFKQCGIVCNAQVLHHEWLEKKPVTHPFLTSPFPLPSRFSWARSWVGWEPHTAEKLPLKSSGTEGKEPESKITLFFGVYHWPLSPSNKALSSEVLKTLFFSSFIFL